MWHTGAFKKIRPCGLRRPEMARLPFSWVKDLDTRADLLYDLWREERDLAELEDPED
jgi:hypothetical protein